MARELWTIGHSTRPIEDFIALLKSHDIRQLVDVRTVPKSRHNPQFDTDALAKSLKKAKIAYRHMPQLGGLRKPKKDSINNGWRNASFRGYADYMQTDDFRNALDELMTSAQKRCSVLMCAEAVPWRCHRSMIADALIIRGWTVLDIITEQQAGPHRLTPFAKVEHGHITYPPPSEERAPGLFD